MGYSRSNMPPHLAALVAKAEARTVKPLPARRCHTSKPKPKAVAKPPSDRTKPLTVILRLPELVLTPNGRPHWRSKAKATKNYRTTTNFVTRTLLNHDAPPWWTEVTVVIRWFHKRTIFPDRDNALASLKSAIDGLTDAGVMLNDRGCVFQPIVFEKDKENPRVELTITPTEARP